MERIFCQGQGGTHDFLLGGAGKGEVKKSYDKLNKILNAFFKEFLESHWCSCTHVVTHWSAQG